MWSYHIIFSYLFTVEPRDPYFHFARNIFIWTFACNGCIQLKNPTLWCLKKKKPTKKQTLINQAVDLNFFVINSTFQSDALVYFISDRILKQILLLMLPQAKYHVLNLPETNKDSLDLATAWVLLNSGPAEKCRLWKDCWIWINCRWLWAARR